MTGAKSEKKPEDKRPAWQKAHDEAVAEGQEMYQDPETRNWVMTSLYLERRGTCCHNGCRHCPYGG